MAQQPTASSPSSAPPHPARPRGTGLAAGGTAFAGVLLVVTGVLSILNGIAGIARDTVYAFVGDYVYEFSLTAWGWIHLILGVLVAVTGFGLLKGKSWARVAGVVLAALYIIENFLFLPYAPVWSVISIAIGVFVIWSLLTVRDTYATR
ncbi:DUF7144 family membrane protein [Streptomyces poonensis]|uniref:DUF7144 domain-containing protein n=1 Tax=Streptomyces poonensis TaxID=68255 RepID=A0A918PKI9_9ACTN|nr:hypothetical protein [Streptomyces poonensis]GGZ12798.1 hypothetical protein GCM10010365_35620 [Streptomyces poonensis]GLJ91983.1 hypothetical protein GCM10017589_45910 [Streptomyces poonensis]